MSAFNALRLTVLCVIPLLSGCATSAAFLAANQPERISVEDILKPGVPKN
jgi:phage terminase large subunit-like protein